VDPQASGGSALGKAVRDAFETLGLTPSIGVMLAMIVALIGLKSLFLWISLREAGFAATGVATDLKLQLLRALTGARWGYYVTQPAGRITNALSGEANKAAASYQQLCALFAGAISVVIYSAVAMLFYWQVVVVGLLVGVGIMILLRRKIAASRSSGKAQTRLSRAINTRLVDVLQGIKAVKASGRERNIWPLLERETRELNQAQRKHIAASATVDAVREPLVVAVLALMLLYLVSYRSEPLSSVIVLALLFQRVMTRVTMLQHSYQAMVVGEASFWSLREAMQVAERNRESAGQESRFQTSRRGYGSTRSARLRRPSGAEPLAADPAG
jgi:ATP-binding cassette subfamily C protein